MKKITSREFLDVVKNFCNEDFQVECSENMWERCHIGAVLDIIKELKEVSSSVARGLV